MILDKSASPHFFLLHSGKTTTLVLLYFQSDIIKTNDIAVSKLCLNASKKHTKNQAYSSLKCKCLGGSHEH